jgi:hypothetical protein
MQGDCTWLLIHSFTLEIIALTPSTFSIGRADEVHK